jgi:hypothetical protein
MMAEAHHCNTSTYHAYKYSAAQEEDAIMADNLARWQPYSLGQEHPEGRKEAGDAAGLGLLAARHGFGRDVWQSGDDEQGRDEKGDKGRLKGTANAPGIAYHATRW